MSNQDVGSIRHLAVVTLLACISATASAQFRGHFSPPDRTYAAGDRSRHIVATFTVKNVRRKPLSIVVAEPPNLCSGYSVEITAIRPPRQLKPGGIAGDCLGPTMVVIAPGGSRSERVDVTMLDYNNFLDTPGDYRIRLLRQLQYTDAHQQVSAARWQKFSASFIVHITRRVD